MAQARMYIKTLSTLKFRVTASFIAFIFQIMYSEITFCML